MQNRKFKTSYCNCHGLIYEPEGCYKMNTSVVGNSCLNKKSTLFSCKEQNRIKNQMKLFRVTKIHRINDDFELIALNFVRTQVS